MNKQVALSYNPHRHTDINGIIEEIKKRKMNVSAVMRELLREFRDRGYCFYTEEQEEELF